MATSTQLDAELGQLRRVVARAEAQERKRRWRVAMQRRTTRVARVLRLLPRAVHGQTVTTRKREGGWEVIADGIVAVFVDTRTPGRCIADLDAPLVVHVHVPELVESGALDAFVLDGTISSQSR